MNGAPLSRARTGISWLGAALVLFGGVLLLRRFGVVDVGVGEILWPALALIGLFLAGRGFGDGRKGKIAGGTALLLFGVFFTLRTLDGLDIPGETLIPAAFLVAGIVFAMLFVNRPADWFYLIPALLLLGVGSAILLSAHGMSIGWELREFFRTWWPVALVLVGLGMLLGRRAAEREGGESAGPGEERTDGGEGSTGTPN